MPLTRAEFMSALVSAAVFPGAALGRMPDRVNVAEQFRRRSENVEQTGLKEPLTGITTNGTVIPDVFHIAPSGVSAEPVRNAAQRFIASLTSAQLIRTIFPVDDVQWRKWANQNYYARQGVSLREMTAVQQGAALKLVRISLSAKGFELIRDIMRLNETLSELTGDALVLGEWAYYITIMGIPSPTEPWGWQFKDRTRSSTTSCLGTKWS